MENNISFKKLTPTDDVDLSIYEDAFCYIFDNDDIRNVAISGPYSAGKSSVLESYKKKHTEKNFIHISLAHFRKDNDKNEDAEEELFVNSSDDEKREIETVLEGKILNQLIQQIDVENIPQTNFHVKREVSNKYYASFTALSVILILSVLGLTYFHSIVGWIGRLPQSWFKTVLKCLFGPYLPLVFFLVSTVIVSMGIYNIVKIQKNKSIFKKLSVQGNEIEIFSDENNSYFDKYLNEVLYLFANTKANVIVFEDIDRFEMGTIFERLREINQLTNIRLKKKNKVIRFFYLLKDDIFVNKDRTKFFDFIMPIIPVVDSSNAFNKFKGYLEQGDLYHLFDENFLRGLSLYIDDLRILKNIYNEFCVYYKKLNKIELNPDKMLAIISYKNIFPKDFAELQLNRGYVYSLFDKKQEFVSDEQDRIQKEIDICVSRIDLCQKEHLRDTREVDTIYNALISELRYYDNEKKGKLEREREERKRILEDRDTIGKNEIKNTIQKLSLEKEQLISKPLKDIITRENAKQIFHTTMIDELDREIKFLDVKGNEYFSLLKYLIWNGYIDDTYNDYISFFYENSLTVNDKMFLRSITDKKAKGYEYPIDNMRLVLENLSVANFEQEETRNFALFQEILKNGKAELFLQCFMTQIQTCNCFEFLYGYLKRGQDIKIFLVQLCKRWNMFFECLLKESVLSENQIHEFAIQLVSILEFDDLVVINIEGCLTNYISSNRGFLEIESPNVESIISNLEKLEVRFIEINQLVSNKELLDNVYSRDLYVLNISNIYMFLSRYYNVNIMDESRGRLLTIIENKEAEPLHQYVRKNISDVVALLLEQEYPITDAENISILVLNLQEIDLEHRKKYIEKLQGKITELKQIKDTTLRDKLIQQNKVKYTLNNIVTYYSDVSGINMRMVSFINNSEVFLESNFDECELLSNFWLQCLSCNEISDDKYRDIVKTIHYSCDIFDVKDINDSKVKILVDEKLILMNEDNLIFMRENYPEVIMFFIKKNLSLYIELVTEKKVLPDEVAEMLEWQMSDSDKVSLLQNATGKMISVKDKEIDDEVFAYILENNFDRNDFPYVLKNYLNYKEKGKKAIINLVCVNSNVIVSKIDEIDLELLDGIIKNNSIRQDEKLEILLSGMKRLSPGRCKEYLNLLSYNEFAKVFEPKRRPHIAVNIENQKILETMRLAGFIKDYEENEDTETYKIKKMEADNIDKR